MTDEAKALVERLRHLGAIDRLMSDPLHQAADLIETQAREIERLGVIAQGNASIVCKILDEKDAEIERLREALAAIADGEGDAQDIARQTLEGDSHDQ